MGNSSSNLPSATSRAALMIGSARSGLSLPRLRLAAAAATLARTGGGGRPEGRGGRRGRRWLRAERVDELPPKTIREVRLAVAELLRQLAGRHVERPEDEVEKREGRGEVLVEPLLLRRVVPAVEHRAGEDVLE